MDSRHGEGLKLAVLFARKRIREAEMWGFMVAIPATCLLAAVACFAAEDILQQHSSFILLALAPSLFQAVVVVRRMIEASRIRRVLARWSEHRRPGTGRALSGVSENMQLQHAHGG